MTSWRDRVVSRRGKDNGEDAGEETAATVRLRAPWSTRAAHVVLWVLVAAGPLAGGVALADRSMSPSDQAAIPADQPSSSAAEGVAEMVVAAWLAGDGDTVAAFSDGDGAGRLDEAELRQRRPRRTAVVAIDERAAGYWAVTVAVDVLAYTHPDPDDDPDDDDGAAQPGGWRREGLRFFRVGVAETGGGLAATSLPAEVAGPSTPDEPVELAVDALTSGVVDEPPVQAVEAFFGRVVGRRR